jgi:dTMP kinase
MAAKGTFIVFEGIDGSGKSTHIKMLAGKLREEGYTVVVTAEPSRDDIGKLIRRYAKRSEERLPAEAEALLFAADRKMHLKKVVLPAIKRGQIVISDRYLHSTLAYQGALGLDLDWIMELNRFALKPDLTILLDILPEYSLERVKRKKTVFEVTEYLRKVREIYLRYVELGDLVKIDADRSRKVIQSEIHEIVQGFLKKVRST